jgi:hypothetical protein
MTEVYRRRPVSGEFAGPGGLLAVPVDRLTGFRAGPLCPADRVYIDYFVQGTEPTQECDGALMMGPPTDSAGNPLAVDPKASTKPKRSVADTANPFRLP